MLAKEKRISRIVLKPARRIYNYVKDYIYSLQNPDSMIPPKSANFVGGGDFDTVGQEFKQHFIELGGLQPNHRVLDVGSGIGRMAVPLTTYLTAEGSYCGIELVSKGVKWCQRRITRRYPNFQFQQCDVFNKMYNPKGKYAARNYKFPFDDGSFDFVLLTSVFTHMLPEDVKNYTKEVSRVLKPGGKCLITFFIMNQESRTLVESGQSSRDFKYQLDGCYTIDMSIPEGAIAFDEAVVSELFASHGLAITKPVQYGSWCGRSEFLSYQDIIVAERQDFS